MERPERRPSTRGSLIPLLLAFVLGSAVVATLSLLTLGFAGVIVALALSMAAFIGLQYLLWGWWLGKMIEDAEAKESPVANPRDAGQEP